MKQNITFPTTIAQELLSRMHFGLIRNKQLIKACHYTQ